MRRDLVTVALLAFVLGAPASRAETYVLDQHYGHIAFSVSNLGLFSSGEFQRFNASLELDGAHPERTMINVDADAG